MPKAYRLCVTVLACVVLTTLFGSCTTNKRHPTNRPPQVNAGPDLTILLPATAPLKGKATDDGLPMRILTVNWSKQSGPGTITFANVSAVATTATFSEAGTYVLRLTATDTVLTSSDDLTVTVNPPVQVNRPPQVNAGPDQTITLPAPATLKGTVTDDGLPAGGTLSTSWTKLSGPGTTTFSNPAAGETAATFSEAGTYVLRLTANDSASIGSDDITVIVNPNVSTNRPPQANAGPDQTITLPAKAALKGKITDDGLPTGGSLTSTWAKQSGPGTVTFGSASTVETTAEFSAAGAYVLRLTANDSALSGSDDITVTVNALDTGLPPDPATVATPIDPTVATTLADATSFLYTGPNPIQTGVAPGTINLVRVAVIRGRVLDKANNALSGVTINILNHPEFGQTLSRADGRFDLAVNGGGQLTVSYVKKDFLPAQRQVNAPWQDYVSVEDTILMQQDMKVTAVNLADTTQPIHIAQGSPVTDQDGTRQATLLIPQGTKAEVYNSDGTTRSVTSLNLRLTEYTAGKNGPASMPAPLPPSSAYTYAFEMRADEAAIKRNGKDVVFDRAVPFYINNFLNFPVGTAVPVGYYDQDKGVWVPSENGKVIKILTVSNGMVEIDSDGDAVADDDAKLTSLGITAQEKSRLAGLYQAGQTLWRVQVKHLSTWDCNWPYKMPDDAEAPKNPEPEPDDTEDNPECTGGSIIECQNQILRESLPINGTGLTLNYASNRVLGRQAGNTAVISLTGSQLPATLKRVDLEIDIAGKHFEQSFGPQPNQRHTFVWDGLDAFGRKSVAGTLAKIRIGYVYPPVYATPTQIGAAFAMFSGVPLEGNRARNEIRIWQEFSIRMGVLSTESQALAGWTLSVQHLYDPIDKTLYLGTGDRRSAKGFNFLIIDTVAGKTHNGGGGNDDGGLATDAKLHLTEGVAVGPDGSFYMADYGHHRIRRVGRDGIISTAAGKGINGSGGDGGPAIEAQLQLPTGVAIGQDGSLYIADRENQRIRRVGLDGIINTVAGTGPPAGFGGDGGPATQASLSYPEKVAVGLDGSLYIADRGNNLIRRVGLDGIISTVVGKPRSSGFSGDGGPATAAQLNFPSDIAVAPDGSLYIADQGNHRIRRVGPDGIISTVAGKTYIGGSRFSGDGGPAVEADLNSPTGVGVGPDGSLYIADRLNWRIRRVGPDGVIRTVAGVTLQAYGGDGGPATNAKLNHPTGVAVGPDGNLYIADSANLRIRRVTFTLPGFSADDIPIASADGTELYRFDARGRHLQTLHAVTGAVLYQFNYDSAGRLISMKDADSNTTTIERDSAGNPITIVAPFGQRTTLTPDTNGYLASVTNPAGEAYRMTYSNDGLLTEFKDPKGNASLMSYDQLGRLKNDTNAAGGSQTLTRTESDQSYTVNLRTTLGRSTSYLVGHLKTGEKRRLTTAPDGTKTETLMGTDGSRKTTLADGTVINLFEGPDPRFGMQAPIPTSLTMTTGGLTSTLSTERTVSLADPHKPLSLTSQTDTIKLNGRTFKSVYDAATKTTTSTSAGGRLSKVTIDNLGRVVQSQITGLTETRIAYDTRGRLETIRQGAAPNSREAKFSYNAEGYLDKLTDPLGRVVSFAYDGAGRVTTQTLPDGRVIIYGYDAKGNLTSLTPPGRPGHVFKYDKVDLTSAYEPPLVVGTGNTVYEYNLDKDLTKITRPDGQTLGFDYDTGGRLQTLALPSGKLEYAYDVTSGKLTKITAQEATLAYTYNGALLTKAAWTGLVTGQVERAYDNDFRVTSLNVNGANPITFEYDADSLLKKAGEMTLTRSGQNGLLEGTGLVGVTDSYAYDGFGQVTAYEAKSNAASLLRFEYTYDKFGRITQKKEVRGGTTHTFDYGYDPAGRLSEVKRDGTVTASYGYDPNGNRTHLNGAQIAHYDAQDRLLDYQGATYQYSANGELQQKTAGSQVTKYGYDVLGNLRKVTLPNGTVIDYLIDGQNRRIGKKVGGTLTQTFLYQSQLRPIAEVNGSGTVVSRFVYAIGVNVPDYMIKGGVTYRIIKGHLGSPRLVVDVATNTVAQELEYDAFGSITKDTNPGFQPFGFAGGLYDRDTKLVRFGVRDYDAEIGRWTAKDPIKFIAEDTNLYGYVLNDPVNNIDLIGLEPNLNLFPVGDPLYDEAQKLPSEKDTFLITGHGNAQEYMDDNGKWRDDVDYLARLIRSRGYKKGMKVKMLQCQSGSGKKPIAQELANKLEETVEAPTGDVEYKYPKKDPTKSFYEVQDGKFKSFEPRTKK